LRLGFLAQLPQRQILISGHRTLLGC
jgi:hypothetical protein